MYVYYTGLASESQWYNITMTDREPHVFPELEQAIDLVVHTKSPEKWILIDRETGKIFQGSANGHWDRLIPREYLPQFHELS